MKSSISISHQESGESGGISFDGKRFHKSHDNLSWWLRSEGFVTRNFEEIAPIFCHSSPVIVSQGMRESYAALTQSDVPWIRAIGKERFLEKVKSAYACVNKLIEDPNVEPYLSTLLLEREVLSLLQQTKIDAREFEKRRSSPSVESFAPNPSGFASAIRYSHLTSTGRLKVVEGPRILTISKQDRRVIASRFSDGRILQVDFVSLEPRVALYSVGQDPGRDDVYEWIAKSVDPTLARSKVKVPTLSILYGQSARNDDPVSSSLRERIGKLFKVDELRGLSSKNGSIRNGYGRPLEDVEDRLKISHYVQSTSVDVALLGFRNLLAGLGSHVGKGIVPIFVLHDALILDVSPELYRMLKEHVERGVDVEPLGHFPLSLGPIWDE